MRSPKILALVLLLAGCSSNGVSNFGELRGRLGQLVISDLDAATANAEAHGDTIAATCYQAIKAYIGEPAETPAAETPDKTGIITLYQKARNLNQAQKQEPPDELKMACSALIVDSQQFVAKIGAMAASGGGSSWLSSLWPF